MDGARVAEDGKRRCDGKQFNGNCPGRDMEAVRMCPFLRSVEEAHGTDYVRDLVTSQVVPRLLDDGADHGSRICAPVGVDSPVLFPEEYSFECLGDAVHGPRGMLPLASGGRLDARRRESVPMWPRQSNNNSKNNKKNGNDKKEEEEEKASTRCCSAAYDGQLMPEMMPCMASISLSGFHFMPDPSDLLQRIRKQRQQRRRQRKRRQDVGGEKPGDGGGGRGGGEGAGGPAKRSIHPLGGLIPLVLGGKIQCPRGIVAMRAAVARLESVQRLRPQSLPIRSLALASVAISFNIPCGMIREHTKKLSPEWFLAVHATIPFVAMLRRAVMMPVWGLGLTVLGSIAGQQVGSVIERKRLDGKFDALVSGARLSRTLNPRNAVFMLLPDSHPHNSMGTTAAG